MWRHRSSVFALDVGASDVSNNPFQSFRQTDVDEHFFDLIKRFYQAYKSIQII
jgi:hypothetical protein